MKLIESKHGHDFYVSRSRNGRYFFNILPSGHLPPKTGYANQEYIENLTGLIFSYNWKDKFHSKKEERDLTE